MLYFVLTMIAVALLVGIGMTMMLRTFSQFSAMTLDNQDQQLMDVATAVDYSIADCFDRYCSDLAYVTDRRGFLEAEEIWRTTGDLEELQFRLEENLLAQSESIQTVIAVSKGNVICTTDGRYDYTLPVTRTGLDLVDVGICLDGENTAYLAFVLEREDISYGALMPLPYFYEMIEYNSAVSTQGTMKLVDDLGMTYLHRHPDRLCTSYISGLSSMDSVDLNILLDANTTHTDFYTATPEDGGNNVRMAVIPAKETRNCRFTVGVANDYDETTAPIRDLIGKFLLFGAMVVLGIVLLLGFALRARYHNEKNAEEVLILREKKEAMEDLNREIQEFAHHQRLEIIGELTSSIAHEFNNLLTPIMGYSIMVLEKLPPEDEDSYDNTLEIYNASRKAKEIISRLSELSRKNNTLSLQYVSPDELVEKVVGITAPAKPKNITVETNLHCCQLWLYGNETQLSQLLLNLIINSFQAMGDTGGELTISTEADDSHIIFRVRDNGPGIPEKIQEKIFDPFFTTKESGKGTGLGLAIVRQVTEEHEGTIELISAPGQGAEFILSFPIIPKED